MSTAKDKNAQAMQALFGSAALVERLANTRVAVMTPDAALPASGRLLAEVLADTLARLWPNIDFAGCAANAMLATAQGAAASGDGTTLGLAARWAPPYDCVVAVGCDAPTASGHVLRVGADGWSAQLSPDAVCGDSANPVGPAFAAAFAAAQVFRRVFSAELHDLGAEPVTEYRFDVRDICGAPNIDVTDIDVGEVHVFGVGAVTHGLMWLLEHWPARVAGLMDLVDKDRYGPTNGQRYAFMRSSDVRHDKVTSMQMRLEAAHAGLVGQVHAHAVDLNTYCAQRGYALPLRRIVVGLDSAESRRHAALKLPEHAVNMWTEGVRVGASRYRPGGNSACLACDYLEDSTSPRDEVGQLVKQTSLRPDIVRALLDTSRGLTQEEAVIVADRWQVQPDALVGQPLRSVMPILCATGRLQLPGNDAAVDVPFAFASLFAGIAGFMMLLKDIASGAPSEGWNQHIFKVPSRHMHGPRHARMECVCCSELSGVSVDEFRS